MFGGRAEVDFTRPINLTRATTEFILVEQFEPLPPSSDKTSGFQSLIGTCELDALYPLVPTIFSLYC